MSPEYTKEEASMEARRVADGIRGTGTVTAILMLLASVAWGASDPAPRPAPPGPHAVRADPASPQPASFRKDQPVVGTYYFYWYDSGTGEHFVDGDGTDALTDHPLHPEGYSYRSAAWHEREIRDILAAGIDFILPVYWGFPGDAGGWSNRGIPPLVEAARSIEAGKGGGPTRAPRVGLFYDTSTLHWNSRGYHADLVEPEGKEWLYVTVRDFYSMVPPDLRACVEGRPIVWLYAAGFAKRHDASALAYLRAEFRKDFGVEPFIVKEASWKGEADATYAWGAAIRPNAIGIAAVGPGYDHSAVPGRTPLKVHREDGALYRRAWEWVLSMPAGRRPKIAVVETWNELHEGTEIAPTKEHGRLYVGLTHRFADLWRSATVLPRSGAYSRAPEVSVILREKDDPRGLARAEAEDGGTRPADLAGSPCRETRPNPPHSGRYMYFDVDDSFFAGDSGEISVEVEYLDRGKGGIGLEYDSTDRAAEPLEGSFKAAPPVDLTDTGAWRAARFTIPDAAFTGRANGHDFRLVPIGPAEIAIRKVTVRKPIGG
jgi:hypothetical protein